MDHQGPGIGQLLCQPRGGHRHLRGNPEDLDFCEKLGFIKTDYRQKAIVNRFIPHFLRFRMRRAEGARRRNPADG